MRRRWNRVRPGQEKGQRKGRISQSSATNSSLTSPSSGPSRPTKTAEAYPQIRENMFPYLEETSRTVPCRMQHTLQWCNLHWSYNCIELNRLGPHSPGMEIRILPLPQAFPAHGATLLPVPPNSRFPSTSKAPELTEIEL